MDFTLYKIKLLLLLLLGIISLSKGKHIVVCLPGARIEHVTEIVEQIMERGNGGSILVHVGTNNAGRLHLE